MVKQIAREKKKTRILEKKLTRVRSNNSGSARKITGSRELAVFLEITVHSIAAVSPHCIRVETGPALVGRVAVRPSSTCIVQSLLQDCITSILANAPCRTYKQMINKT